MKAVDLSEKETTPLWDHKLDELVKDTIGIKTINAQFVLDNWMKQAFVSFVFKYARLVSNTKESILDKTKDDPSNLFALLEKSDISWAVLIYLNNTEYWEEVITKEAARKKGQEIVLFVFAVAVATMNTQKRGRPTDKTLSVPGTDEGGIGENPQAKTRQRWTIRKRNEIGGDRFPTKGKLVYFHVHEFLKAINSK